MNYAEEFKTIFAGLDRAHGAYILSKPKPVKGKYKGEAYTKAEPVTLDLWEQHLAGKRGLGIVPIRDDNTCVFGAIDIDKYDIDNDFLSRKIAKMGLPLLLFRTKSGGAHLFLFLSEPLPAEFVRGLLTAWAAELGYAGSEIFPKQNRLANQKDIGNWINMPYFHYKKADRVCIYNGEELSIKVFINLVEEMKVDESALQAHIYKEPEKFVDGPPCLQTLARRGFTEGSRNNALFDIGIYLKLRWGDDFEEHLYSYNAEFFQPPLKHSEVAQIIKNVSRTKAIYRCEQPPICDACNKPECRKRKYGIGTSENKEPGVPVDMITCLEGETYSWIMQVHGERIQVNTDEMLNYRLFKRKCVEKLRILPNAMKNDAWENYIADMIKAAEVISVPEEAGNKGIFLHHLESFTTSQVLADDKEGLLRGKPYKNGGRIYFRLPDLMKYLDQQRVKNVNRTHMWQWLHEEREAKHHQFNIKGKCVKCWSVLRFPEQTEDFDVPKVDVGEF